MMSLLHPTRPDAPHLTSLHPLAALPGGSFELTGTHLLSSRNDQGSRLPSVFLGETEAGLDLLRPNRAQVRVPEGAIASDLILRYGTQASNALHANVAVPMTEDLHMISNPAVDLDGNLFAMISGPRGTRVPVSIMRISRDLQARPFVRDLLNVSALAFGPDGYLYASSRAEGIIYRISPEGAVSTFAEGMGLATGIAFDKEGNLFVGDRSGTIFKLGPHGRHNAAEIFVFATLEPSVAAYHLAFRDDGILLVTAPTTSSHQAIHAIDPDGTARVFFRGLGRPQGMALDTDGNVYVAASLGGRRGIVRVGANGASAELVVSGNDLVGLCFTEDGYAALATAGTLYQVDLGITGRILV
ncbi:MAG: SMP-30/gluconolactonase/LRE family protein [Janthinobacterium lividum]